MKARSLPRAVLLTDFRRQLVRSNLLLRVTGADAGGQLAGRGYTTQL